MLFYSYEKLSLFPGLPMPNSMIDNELADIRSILKVGKEVKLESTSCENIFSFRINSRSMVFIGQGWRSWRGIFQGIIF